ncbi:hypothetical protein [Carnobacterium mobile]|uniref:hypothetical protein n=1 Tax=Carnobacterium mobile TaxID=2750 RepID=UPI000B2F1062
MFRSHYNEQPVRQIAIHCGKIDYKNNLQLNFFEPPEKTIHKEELEIVIDRIRERYGFTSLMHASSLLRGGTAIQRSQMVGGHKG